MGSLLILLFIVASFFIVRAYLRARDEQRLRDNYPQRRVIEVTLPAGISDSRIAMARFFRKVASATTIDPKARKQGVGQIDFVYLGSVPQPRAMPRISCLIYADPDKMDSVKRALKGTFDDLDVVEHEEDPLLAVAEALKPNPAVEPEQMGQEAAAHV